MNLPNALTLGRIFLVPLLVVVLLTRFEAASVFGVRKELVGAAIFGLASLTDWLDGYLARRRKQVTALGQLMDPLADKLLITAALVSLVQMDLAPGVDGGRWCSAGNSPSPCCAASRIHGASRFPPLRSASSRWRRR
jgi:CDP-diacylglycerol--glycerol-3-phosphate 3-phosphatidyltransferase